MKHKKYWMIWAVLLLSVTGMAQQSVVPAALLEKKFLHPPASAKPWVFWYWMYGAVSKAGITADLEAMKEAGIGGAYLMPIKDTSATIPFQPTVRQLTPEWWAMVRFAMQEAKRLNLQLAMHLSDGFALAGGPWISPASSMQKLVWTKQYVKSGNKETIRLEQPETNEGYYKDIAVYAYPARSEQAFSGEVMIPVVTASNGAKAQFLSFPDPANKQSFKTDSAGWIQYAYPKPFTCRSIRIHTGTNSYQAQRLIVQTSNDGLIFNTVTRMESPRHGWQDTDEDYTHAIPARTARYFRFVYDKEGTEPGSEDLDAAKWKPSLKLMGVYLSDEPVIHQVETKNGSIWRVAANTTTAQVTDKDAVPLKNIIDLTHQLDSAGNLNGTLPDGNWVIVRIGHTSTGHTNATGGGGKGLECDKFSADAVRLQFDNWFARAFEKTDPVLAKEVLKVFHVDSWECGSQNWSDNFTQEFKKRRGYDLLPYLLVMTGVPVENAERSEKIAHDVRQTIADLISDVFYATLHQLAQEKGCSFSAESVAPTMVSDGLLHYKNTDMPMGEFWLNSPTHDKPNDVLDAISGAHIYGKRVIQAEAFTSVRMNWAEHPGNLKILGDLNFALGINKMVLHVFTHNPWMNKRPGMTLDGIGLYFQRDQTWFAQGKAWIDYLTRCQSLLQSGDPVTDIAVFTGEEVPRRSLLPDRLVNALPGIFGKEKVEAERIRLENKGQPLRTIPDGVTHSANMADPENWIDPLNGYAYDSFNPDALMQMKVKNGRVVLPGGASYAMLVLPAKHLLQPNDTLLSLPVAKKLLQLLNDGARILMNRDYSKGIGLKDDDAELKQLLNELFSGKTKKGRLIFIPYQESSFSKLGLEQDLRVESRQHTIAWTHRRTEDADLYFISNQSPAAQVAALSFRISGKVPELWDPVTATIKKINDWREENNRILVSQSLEVGQSLFIVFREKGSGQAQETGSIALKPGPAFSDRWTVSFDKKNGGPATAVVFPELKSWSQHPDPAIRYYSGTAVYNNVFSVVKKNTERTMWIKLDTLYDIATIKVNGINCGTLWTPPYELEITKALKPGKNKIEIAVTNTWHNRLIGDDLLPASQRITWTNAPFRLKNKPLLPAGLVGTIKLLTR